MTSSLKTFLFTFLAGLALGAHAGTEPDPADRIVGLWVTDKGEGHVEIFKEQDGYAGRLVWIKEPFFPEDDPMAGEVRIDRENPDPELRDRPVEGLKIMQGFAYDGDDRWTDGTIYDPENGKTYRCKIWLTDDGHLKVRGYVGISLFGRTTEWIPLLGSSGAAVDTDEPDQAPAMDDEQAGTEIEDEPRTDNADDGKDDAQ
ncbi:MAG: DUF2147 domain-containing protein [Gammaproteobacteria bacterium]|nr:DUF2147 domain-containing protein [Gammaproteobacteria bacterium]